MVSQLSGKGLAVIKAPAGFGKTSLAAAWSQELQQSENADGWLTIDGIMVYSGAPLCELTL
jgi:LuxR family maltose regulon positive regulatory protein